MKILPVFALAGLISCATGAQEVAAPKKAGDLITVTSDGGAERDQEKNLMVYTDTVKFTHPAQGLEIACERLEARQIQLPAGLRISKAIATGNVVVRKMGANGKVSIAKGQKAEFDAETSTTTLSGKPQPMLEVGDFLYYADTIILQQNGQHRLGNHARTVFKKAKEAGRGR